MHTVVVHAFAIGLAAGSAMAFAGHRQHVEYARVTGVEPITETISYNAPREQCWTEQVPVHDAAPRSYTAPIVGAIIGGALGNAAGHHKSNQRVGAVVGAALGASIGRDISYRNAGGYRPTAYADEQICRMVDDRAYREEVIAYRVSYKYHGRHYTTELPYDPGERLPVNVNVEPARW
jgi:uncharacterized protein YcfJ